MPLQMPCWWIVLAQSHSGSSKSQIASGRQAGNRRTMARTFPESLAYGPRSRAAEIPPGSSIADAASEAGCDMSRWKT